MSMKKLLGIILVVGIIFTFSGCNAQNDKKTDIEENVDALIQDFLDAHEDHDIKGINSLLSDDVKYSEEKEYLDAYVNKIEKCKLIKTEFLSSDDDENSLIKVNILYEVTFSKDYDPVGYLQSGKNKRKQSLTISNVDDELQIIDIQEVPHPY
jgi:hypothetical protein